MSRTLRAPAAFAAVVGVLLGLLVCGTTPAVASSVVASAGAPSTAVVVDAGAPSPGCDQGHTSDGAARPATPPRPNGFGELLPVLAAERPAEGAFGGDQDIRDLLPGPEPPELVPPSPMELSILRV
ncbi:hypothetical protein [Streptomyces sp. NPDC093600]|uniref:hypothetical protein n=1 Tax=Streptomyces sp. NPDC093600 TaxID=3366047 RepID=UPI00381CA5EA